MYKWNSSLSGGRWIDLLLASSEVDGTSGVRFDDTRTEFKISSLGREEILALFLGSETQKKSHSFEGLLVVPEWDSVDSQAVVETWDLDLWVFFAYMLLYYFPMNKEDIKENIFLNWEVGQTNELMK